MPGCLFLPKRKMTSFSIESTVVDFEEEPEESRIRKERDRRALLDAILHLHNRCGKKHFVLPRGVENADERIDLKAARELDWSINRCLEDRSDNLEFLMDKLDFLEDAQKKCLKKEKIRKNKKRANRRLFFQKIWRKIKHPFGNEEEIPEPSAEASELTSNSSNVEFQEVERICYSFRTRKVSYFPSDDSDVGSTSSSSSDEKAASE
uniref:Uncharacterized protein n=1 Tax=Panagrolaimus sp. JU765 TaxID=591449 RepID=A0AC34QCJ8_9BILA